MGGSRGHRRIKQERGRSLWQAHAAVQEAKVVPGKCTHDRVGTGSYGGGTTGKLNRIHQADPVAHLG